MARKSGLLVLLCVALFGIFGDVHANAVKARASHILVDSEEQIDELKAQLDASENVARDFAELARVHSKCPSGKSGGELGSFGRGRMVPEFDRVVFEQEVGVVHKVKTQFGWHLVYTSERTGGDSDKKTSTTTAADDNDDKDSIKRQIMIFLHKYNYVLGPLGLLITLFLMNFRPSGISLPRARACHILVKTEAEADALLKEIEASENPSEKFAELAKAKSKCPSGRKGGDLGMFGKGQMAPPFERVVFDPENVVDKVYKVETQFGWHLIVIKERIGMGRKEKKEN